MSMFPLAIADQPIDPNQPDRVPLLNGESRMTPAPWQLPSGGATTPQAVFQNDFATAQDFRDRAIASGADPQEADATYFAPLRTKWKTIAAAPELFKDNNKFLQFNTEFSKATDNYNSEVHSGRSPKAAAEISLMPVLQKWTLNPTNVIEKDADVKAAIKTILTDPSAKITDVMGKVKDLTVTQANALMALDKRVHPTPAKAPSLESLANEAKIWQARATDENNTSENRAIAQKRYDELQAQSYDPYKGLAPQIMPGTPRWMNIPKQADTLNVPRGTLALPKDKAALVDGETYQTGRGVFKWDAKKQKLVSP